MNFRTPKWAVRSKETAAAPATTSGSAANSGHHQRGISRSGETSQEGCQLCSLVGLECSEFFGGSLAFAAVSLNRLLQRCGAAVVQIRSGTPHAPERWCPPLLMNVRRDVLHEFDPKRLAVRAAAVARSDVLIEFGNRRERIGQVRSHVVQQQIAEEAGDSANIGNVRWGKPDS